MAANLSGNPMGSSYMASKEANDLQFLGANPQKSESVTRSYGAGGGLVGHLNQQNLGGLGGGSRPQNASSEVGSLYRGEGLGREEDALSHFMGQSDYGGQPTEIGVTSLVGGQNNATSGFGA